MAGLSPLAAAKRGSVASVIAGILGGEACPDAINETSAAVRKKEASSQPLLGCIAGYHCRSIGRCQLAAGNLCVSAVRKEAIKAFGLICMVLLKRLVAVNHLHNRLYVFAGAKAHRGNAVDKLG